MGRLIRGAEIDRLAVAMNQPPKHGPRFGRWEFDEERLTLDNGFLEVDLERMTDPATTLHELLRLAGKDANFLPDEDLGSLLRALNVLMPSYAGVSRESLLKRSGSVVGGVRRVFPPATNWTWSTRPRTKSNRSKA